MAHKRLAVVGAGLIGVRHAELIAASDETELAAIADPSDAGPAAARRFGAAHYVDFTAMLDRETLDGVIVATPNQLHLPVGLACVERGLPALVEKPLTDTLEAGVELVTAAERHGVPLMVGHHRRFHPMVETTRTLLRGGVLGRLVAVNAMWAVRKPDAYFDVAWRRVEGGGPILVNLIHDVDSLRHFCGEVESVQAFASTAVRGFEVEDTAAVVLRLAGDVLATVLITDAAPSPWGWEAGSGDNPGIAASGENCYRFLGTEAALDFPNLTLWRTAGGGTPSWDWPVEGVPHEVHDGAALPAQLRHFVRVIDGETAPRVSARDGLATLAATLAVKESIGTGQPATPALLPTPD